MEKGDTFSGLSLTDTIPLLIINGYSFKNVDKFKITKKEQCFPVFDNDMYLYFSDSVGLIKKEILDKYGNIESWSLLRWKVIR